MLPLTQYSGLDDGQPADRPGHRGHADADGRRRYSAIANGGILRPPHIVDSVGGKTTEQPAGQARDLRGDRGVGAHDARGRRSARAAPPPAPRSRATSSPARRARPRRPINGDYSKDKYVASFVGFAPAKHPKLLVAVIVDEPKGEIYGGQVAAPAWKEIVNFALGYLQDPARVSLQSAWHVDDAPSRSSTSPSRSRTSTCSTLDLALREALVREGAAWAVERVREAGRGGRPRPRAQAHGAAGRAQRAAADHPRPLRPPRRPGRARPVAGTGCSTARSRARSTRCRGRDPRPGAHVGARRRWS